MANVQSALTLSRVVVVAAAVASVRYGTKRREVDGWKEGGNGGGGGRGMPGMMTSSRPHTPRATRAEKTFLLFYIGRKKAYDEKGPTLTS